ncbi:spermidine synthase [Actinopolyspora xinjiangensis]|uniref:Polyamine aminopropyltransferase n=1 Tax=Actinopolyspora xinjiangensis TaxID=405564 RepID=A0A1H0PFR8_9ACTN|nr:polyamine aminopropyltransferase [Actinopolyspora xinjiangensis]SDP03508.1 spermidine synthase [Actinopolyspora xinjiangensis]
MTSTEQDDELAAAAPPPGGAENATNRTAWFHRPGPARFAVLLAVFVCSACGLVYELALVALGSYLIGNSVGQASIVLSLMVFAMGIGALVAKPLQRWAALSFVVVELVLALLGGLSVLGLYAAFAWLSLYTPMLIVTSLVLGTLIGAEIPLLMVLLQRIRRQEAGSAVADMFAADYVGALIGGLAFPFLLLPLLGQVRGALLVGMLNAAAGLGLILTVYRNELGKRLVVLLTALVVLIGGVLGGAFALSGRFETTARQALYDDPVVHAERSKYQEIVLTRSRSLSGRTDTRLFLNGDLQFSSVDERRYHEALVHPAMVGDPSNVLILGGGDGLALREVLRYPEVERVTLVELDPAVLRLGRQDPRLTSLNEHAFDDPRVNTVAADAFSWLRRNGELYDAILVDMPDPDSTETAKLYSTEFYSLVRRSMAEGARVNVQAGSPYFAPEAYWCVEASMRQAGLATVPYSRPIPSFGQWGFQLGVSGDSAPRPRLAEDVPELRTLDERTLRAATVFPPDRDRIADVEPSTLMHPRIVEYERGAWRNY